MGAALDRGQEILSRIADLEVERARIEAETASLMLEFADLRRVQADRHDDPRLRELQAGFAADELGVALHQPTRTVQCRLADARRIRGLMPNTWEAFGRGEVDTYRMSLIASAVAKLNDNYQRIDLDDGVAAYAASHTTAQLKAKLRRYVARCVPDQTAAKAEFAKRSVWVDHQGDGMSFLHAYIPTTDAIRIHADTTARAKALSDDRTLDQRRADLFVEQMLGTVDGQSTGSRAVIGVVVPVTTLAGVTDEPGTSFDGSFSLPADLVRDLAAEPGTLFYRIIKDPLGRILDIVELGRFPSEKLKIGLEIRDGTCRFPTCDRPAMESDKDHEIPHPRGPTTGSNLRSLCRRHHNIKTHQIAEPTRFAMKPRMASRLERDFATFVVNLDYAA